MRIFRLVLAGMVPAGIALAAYLNASAVSALMGGTISGSMLASGVAAARAGTETEAEATAHAMATGQARLDAKSARAILNRNPFDHVTGPLLPPESQPPPGAIPRDLDPKTAPLCEGVKPLIVVGDEDQTVAFTSLDYGGKRILRKRGGEVGESHVAYVGRDRVWLEGRNGLCQALLFGDPLPVKPATGSEVAAPGAAGRSAFELEIEKKIVKTGPNEFSVDRSAVERIIEAQQEIMKSRIVPEKEQGRTVGMKISGIKPGSVVGMLGIENNDRLETINGYDMTDPEKMLEAFARLRTGADKLTIHLTRGGKPINVDYNIR